MYPNTGRIACDEAIKDIHCTVVQLLEQYLIEIFHLHDK
jgi:hypothetical protein